MNRVTGKRLASLAIFVFCAARAQNVDSTSGIALSAKISQRSLEVDNKVIVELSINNRTKDLLQIPVIVGLSAFEIIVQDDKGVSPAETVAGCKLHASSACGPDIPLPTVGRSDSLYVGHGENKVFRIDISNQYVLKPGVRYSILIGIKDARLVNVPDGAQLYEVYAAPHTKIGTILSNTLVLEKAP